MLAQGALYVVGMSDELKLMKEVIDRGLPGHSKITITYFHSPRLKEEIAQELSMLICKSMNEWDQLPS